MWQIHNNYKFLWQFTVQRRKCETLLQTQWYIHIFNIQHYDKYLIIYTALLTLQWQDGNREILLVSYNLSCWLPLQQIRELFKRSLHPSLCLIDITTWEAMKTGSMICAIGDLVIAMKSFLHYILNQMKLQLWRGPAGVGGDGGDGGVGGEREACNVKLMWVGR